MLVYAYILDTFLQFETNNKLTIYHEIKLKIFVPFVANKPEDSGIGLAVTCQIMRMPRSTLRLKHNSEGRNIISPSLL